MPVSTFWHEVQSQVRARAPHGLIVFALLMTLSLVYEAATYPARLPLVSAAWLVNAALVGGATWLASRRPERSVEILVGTSAMAGAIIAGYHFVTAASAEWLLLVLTGLLCSVSLFFPWGWRAQLLASSGAVLGFVTVVFVGVDAVGPVVTPLTYLACVVGLTCYGAELSQKHLRQSFYLTRGIVARETRLRSYLDQALIGIGVVAPDGTWREVNDALTRMVKFDRDALLGRPWVELLNPDEIVSGKTAVMTSAHNGAPGNTVDVQLRTSDGQPVHVCIASRSFSSPDGVPEETVVMVLDITDRKRAQAELELARDIAESAYAAKSEFLAHMSHELRTPMNIIFGMTEMAMDESVSGDQLDVLGRTRDAAKSLLVLVDDVLDLARIETGRMRLHNREFGLREWLAGVVAPMSTLADAKGLELSWEVAPTVRDRVLADPDRMRQVLVNLVGNAIKFTQTGSIRVRVDRSKEGAYASELEFSVEDTGDGIPSQQQELIFEAFVQGGALPQPGTGLGLSICSHLVELMGGRIWVESEVGVGSCFHFTAPGAERYEA